ncbi:hypothetical protein [Rhizobium sp. 21-4511-3d]
MNQNETERHFQQRNLDKDMAEAHKNAFPVLSKKQASRRYSSTVVLGTAFVALCTLIATLLGGAEIWMIENG